MSNKKANVWFMIASAPVDLAQPIEQKHAAFFSRMKDRGQVCGLQDGIVPPIPKLMDTGAYISATRYMTKDIRLCSPFYARRSATNEEAKDVLNLAIRLNRVDSKVIVDDVFMFYVRSFGAAYAVCYDDRLGAWSFNAGKAIYSLTRRGEFIRQLTWLSNVRAWEDLQISAKEIGQRVESAAERVEYFDDGVYIVLDSRPLTMAEAKEKTLAANLALYPEIAPIIPSLRAIYADE